METRTKRYPSRIMFTIVGIAIVCGIMSYQVGAIQALSSNNIQYLNELTTVINCKYLVVIDDSGLVSAKNCDTSQIESSGTNASTVIQYAQDHMNSREKLLIRGNFNIPNPVNITNSINIEHQGKATLTGTGPYMIFQTSEQAKDISVYLGEVNGQDKSRDCIKVVSGVGHATMDFGLLVNCNHAIYLDSGSGSSGSYGDINFYGDIEGNNYGIYFDTPGGAGEPAREGMVFHGAMFGNSHGVYISSGNTEAGAFVLGTDAVVDNAGISNSWDFEDYSQNNLAHTLTPKYIRWGTAVISQTYFVPQVEGFGKNTVNLSAGREMNYPLNSAWSTLTTGTAGSAPTYNPALAQFSTATSTNSGRQIYSPNNFALNVPMVYNYRLNVVNMTNSLVRTGFLSSATSYVSTDNAAQGVQVKWDGSSWKVIVSDGSTSQSLNTNLTSQDITVTIHVIPNKAVTAWVKGSTTKVVQTTSGPLPNSGLVPFFNIQTTDGVSKTLAVQQYPKAISLEM